MRWFAIVHAYFWICDRCDGCRGRGSCIIVSLILLLLLLLAVEICLLYFYGSMFLCIYLSIRLFILPSVRLSINLFIDPSIYPSMHSFYSSIYLFTYLSIPPPQHLQSPSQSHSHFHSQS